MTTYTLRPAGSDNLTASDYRDMFEELREGRSLRELVSEAGAAEGRIAYWSRYGRNPDAAPDLEGRNELRRLVGLPELAPPAGDVVTAAVDPAAAVWQVGAGAADRVVLLATPGPLTIHVNGNGPQVVDSRDNALYTDVHSPRSAQKRKAYLTVRLPVEWRSELKSRGLTVRQIVAAALEVDA
jgi:hypothetical protein